MLDHYFKKAEDCQLILYTMRKSRLIWKRNEMKLYSQTRFLIIFLYNGRNEIKLYNQSKTDENKSPNRRRFLLVTIQMPHEPPFFLPSRNHALSEPTG